MPGSFPACSVDPVGAHGLIRRMITHSDIKLASFAWGLPLCMVGMAILIGPNPFQSKERFPVAEFIPKKVEVVREVSKRGSDSFVLHLTPPDGGDRLSHTDPEESPVVAIESRIPHGAALRVIYASLHRGNVILEITRVGDAGPPLLAFADVMEDHLNRRVTALMWAGFFFVAGNTIIYFRWKKSRDAHTVGDP